MIKPKGKGAPKKVATFRHSVHSLFDTIQQQDSNGDRLAKEQTVLNDLKKEISTQSKKNFTIEREIRNLDEKIALLIRNRISFEEVMASSGDISLINRTTTLKDKRLKEVYGQLFYVLQTDTRFIATLASLVKLGEIDNLLQTVMFTLYGNQYDESEEHLLLSMFKKVLAHEFNNATGIGSLLRANTALTRMMTTYTRRGPGQQYLKEVFTPVLSEITEQPDLILEINPSKVYEAWINELETTTGQVSNLNRKTTAEEAAQNEEVQKIIAPRIQKLAQIVNQFLDAIIASMDQIPYGIRWICKQIQHLCKQKFPQATRAQSCSLIGGFFLLRFINPAIVTPQAFMLVESKLSANTRRNLTLLAKVLQNLANNIQFGGVKEFYMSPLNPVLEKNRERINDFLENLTKVEDLDTHLQMDKYLAMGKTTDSVINISLNEMYFVHALLLQHIDVVCAGDDPLREILKDLGPAPSQLPRKDNANVDLRLASRFDQEDGGTEEGEGEITPEQLYTETKYYLFMLLRAIPTITITKQTELKNTLKEAEGWAKQNNFTNLQETIHTIQSNIEKVAKLEESSLDDCYLRLNRDAIQELLNYEEEIKRVADDKERLKKVLASLQDHNKFLHQQYEAYKEYLENVRESCTGRNKFRPDKADKKGKKVKNKAGPGPFKFTYLQLEKDGIIIDSQVPDDKRSNISFQFACSTPGHFEVTVMYRGKNIFDFQLVLDDLLEKQHNNIVEFETEFAKLNVNILLYLLNKTFLKEI